MKTATKKLGIRSTDGLKLETKIKKLLEYLAERREKWPGTDEDWHQWADGVYRQGIRNMIDDSFLDD